MAESKKSFVLYVDQRGTFNKLSDEQAGILIKHIFSYVSDENPKGDFITELAFEAIMRQLKRDLIKYKNAAERSRENGKLGGRPKSEDEPRKPSGLIDNLDEPRKPDNVNVNGNVSVNGNVNVKEKVKKKKEEVVFPFDSKEFKNCWQIWKNYKKEEHKFSYKTTTSEQGALMKLNKLSDGHEKKAIDIINESISNGWKGFFLIDGTSLNGNDMTESEFWDSFKS